MEFKIENTEVYGLNKAIISSGNSFRTKMADNTKEPTEKDLNRAKKLGMTATGTGHDQFLAAMIVQFDIYAPLYMWKEIQRYKFLDFSSSQSTMHCITKFKLNEQCVSDTDKRVIDICQEMIDEYNKCVEEKILSETELKEKWRKIIASLPCGFVLGATMSTNYRQLKTIYQQRKNHRLKEWHKFCEWCETLPLFKEIVLGENPNE